MPKPENKQIIAVDIDDVLASNAEAFVKFSNQRWGTKLTIDDYSEHWAEMWGIDHDELRTRGDVIFQEKVFLKHRFFDESKPVLQRLAQNYTLVIASSRNKRIQKETIAWIKAEYGDIFSGFHFADIWNRQDLHFDDKFKMTKAKILDEIGAAYLIDDQPKHCIAAADAGITALLFGEYGWNRDVELKPRLVQVKNWQEVEDFFDAKS